VAACCSLIFSSVPTGQPTNVSATPVNSTSVTISWDPPLPEIQNGVIVAYAINLTTVGGSGNISEYSSDRNNITVVLLNPFTTYVYTVAAQTSVGTGPFTNSFTVMTLEDGMFTALLYH